MKQLSGTLDTHSIFSFSLHFQRLYVDQLTSTYFQTFMLWLLAYLTLLLPVRNLNERFMGAVTALLVLAALLGSMRNTLPTSAQMNFIDYWFLWYIINIFFIIVFHVILEKLKYSGRKNELVNRIASFLLPFFMLVFNLVYFVFSVMQIF